MHRCLCQIRTLELNKDYLVKRIITQSFTEKAQSNTEKSLCRPQCILRISSPARAGQVVKVLFKNHNYAYF